MIVKRYSPDIFRHDPKSNTKETMLDKKEYDKFYEKFSKGRSSILRLTDKSGGLEDSSSLILAHKTMKSYGLSSEEIKLKTNLAKWTKITFSQPIDIKSYPSGRYIAYC